MLLFIILVCQKILKVSINYLKFDFRFVSKLFKFILFCQMESTQIPWQRYEENIKAAEMDWERFPKKEDLNHEKCVKIDLLFLLLNDTLRQNDQCEAVENQLQLLLTALAIAFRTLCD